MNKPIGDRKMGRILMQVLWPAFLMSIVAEGVFFSMIDPQELDVVGLHLADSREAAYTIGFFVFWALFTISSGLTYLLAHGSQPPPDLLQTPEDRKHQDKALIGR
ncbi:MAG: hypothetical protein ACLGII_09665 [Gammaproteobacteria bacterium]